MEAICKNCEAPLEAEFDYCPKCSQKVKLHRLTMHDVFHEGIHYFTHADKGLFQLIRDLVIKRGVVAREYVEGKRKKYFPPLNFYLLIAAVFVFMMSLQPSPEPANVLKDHPELTHIPDPVKKEMAIAIYERMAKVTIALNKYANLLAMVSLPLSAFFFWLFFRKGKYNYTEHLVAGMYMSGICILVYAVAIVPIFGWFDTPKNYSLIFFALVQLLYFTIFYSAFLNKKTIGEHAKIFVASFVALAAWMTLSGLVVGLYIRHGFWGLLH